MSWKYIGITINENPPLDKKKTTNLVLVNDNWFNFNIVISFI